LTQERNAKEQELNLILSRTPQEHWRLDLDAFLTGLAAWEVEERAKLVNGKKVTMKSKRKPMNIGGKAVKKSKYVEESDDGQSIF
jgi:hypothetical protein